VLVVPNVLKEYTASIFSCQGDLEECQTWETGSNLQTLWSNFLRQASLASQSGEVCVGPGVILEALKITIIVCTVQLRSMNLTSNLH